MWVAVGSQARRELTPVSIAAGGGGRDGPAPPEWAGSVGAALAACGFPDRRVVARTAAEWSSSVHGPLTSSGCRCWSSAGRCGGRRSIRCRSRTAFVTRWSRRWRRGRGRPCRRPGSTATRCSRPTARASDRLDIRRATIAPIVELARWASAISGLVEGSTPERLRAAAAGGALRDEDARTLADAFELGLELRIAHHMEQLAEGRPPDDRIDCARISPLMRDHLARRVPRGGFRAAGPARVRPTS